MKLIRFLAPICLMVMPLVATAEPITGINWRSGLISATGIGVSPDRITNPAQAHAMACRAAMVVAQRNLLETTKGVRVDSMTLVKDAMVESDLIRTSVQGIIKGARMSNKHLMDDGSCEVTAIMPIAGDLFAAVISEEQFRKEVAGTEISQLDFSERMQRLLGQITRVGLITVADASPIPVVAIEGASQLKLAEKLQVVLEAQGDHLGSVIIGRAINNYRQVRDFTGIVIDASSVRSFHAAAMPWIRDQHGVKLYPNGDTPYEVVRSSMPVAYDFSVKDAVQNKRVATVPLVVNAVSTYKSKTSDLMLDSEGEKKFLDLMHKGVINKKARIMIVVAD
ncbi:MAG: hypothetical protein Q9M31_05060 [Mariprofundus sp.]|nr:hypothetical protein [Mariprofundus sp.]